MDSFQLALTVALTLYLGQWRHSQVRRNQRSWQDVFSLLRGDGWALERTDDVHSLRAAFASAPLLIQVADYATEHGSSPDISLLEGLRRDAFQIRLFALAGLAKHLLVRSDAR
jgi:hypothetical protein